MTSHLSRSDPNSVPVVTEAPILELNNISKRFTKKIDMAARLVNIAGFNYRDRTVHAVDRVHFSVNRGEVVGLIGESGCGKSTLGRSLVNLYNLTSGSVVYRDSDQKIDLITANDRQKKDYTKTT